MDSRLIRPNLWLGTSIENRSVLHRIDALRAVPAAVRFLSVEPLLEDLGPINLAGISWIIVGGESGPHARPCDVEWVRSIIRQCKAAGVRCFVKQMGAFVVDRNDAGFEAETETWADGPDAGKPTRPESWPTPVDVVHDLDGTIDGYQGAPVRVVLADRKGGDMEEWPEDLRIREVPTHE